MLLVPFLSPPLAATHAGAIPHPPSPPLLLLASSPFTEPAQNTHLRCRWVSSLFPLPGPCLFPAPTPPAAASGWPPPRDRVPSPLGHLTSPNAPKREGSHGSQRQTDLPGRTPGRAGTCQLFGGWTGRLGARRGPGAWRWSIPYRPVHTPRSPPRLHLAISPGIHGDRRGGGGICWSGGRDVSLDSRPGAASSARCPLPTVGPRCQAQAPWGRRPALSRSPLDLAASTSARARPKAGVWSPPHCPVIPRHRLT